MSKYQMSKCEMIVVQSWTSLLATLYIMYINKYEYESFFFLFPNMNLKLNIKIKININFKDLNRHVYNRHTHTHMFNYIQYGRPDLHKHILYMCIG